MKLKVTSINSEFIEIKTNSYLIKRTPLELKTFHSNLATLLKESYTLSHSGGIFDDGKPMGTLPILPEGSKASRWNYYFERLSALDFIFEYELVADFYSLWFRDKYTNAANGKAYPNAYPTTESVDFNSMARKMSLDRYASLPRKLSRDYPQDIIQAEEKTLRSLDRKRPSAISTTLERPTFEQFVKGLKKKLGVEDALPVEDRNTVLMNGNGSDALNDNRDTVIEQPLEIYQRDTIIENENNRDTVLENEFVKIVQEKSKDRKHERKSIDFRNTTIRDTLIETNRDTVLIDSAIGGLSQLNLSKPVSTPTTPKKEAQMLLIPPRSNSKNWSLTIEELNSPKSASSAKSHSKGFKHESPKSSPLNEPYVKNLLHSPLSESSAKNSVISETLLLKVFFPNQLPVSHQISRSATIAALNSELTMLYQSCRKKGDMYKPVIEKISYRTDEMTVKDLVLDADWMRLTTETKDSLTVIVSLQL